MIKRMGKSVAVGVAALGLLAGGTPAAADYPHYLASVFTGTATTPALGYPILDPTGASGTWTVTVAGGVGAQTVGHQPDIGVPVGSATGVLHGGTVNNLVSPGAFCGGSGGSGGIGSIDIVPGSVPAAQVRNVGWVQSVGQLIVLTGDEVNHLGGTPELVAVLSAIPPLPGAPQSCSSATAISFTIVGTAVIVVT